jgi:hypothetical protein
VSRKFAEYVWDFAAFPGVAELSGIIGDELTWLRALLIAIPRWPLGDRLLRLAELNELFEKMVLILREAGFDATPWMILAAIMPVIDGGEILKAFMRTFWIVGVLWRAEIKCPQMDALDSFWSWISHILIENQEFLEWYSEQLKIE